MRAEPFLVSRFSCQEEQRKTTTDPNLPEDIPKNNNNNVVGDVFISRGEIFGLWPLNSLSLTTLKLHPLVLICANHDPCTLRVCIVVFCICNHRQTC